MFSDFARQLAQKIGNAQGVQIGRALNFGQIGDMITVQIDGQRTTKQFRAATPVNSHAVIIMGDQVFCESAPRVLRTEAREFLKVRPQKRGVILEKPRRIKWLLASIKESTNELILRIGGQTKEPRIILTLPYNVNNNRLFEVYPVAAEESNSYFSFHLNNTGPSDNDWVLSYGKFVVNTYTNNGVPPWQNSRTVTLYKVTPAGTEEILTETVVHRVDDAFAVSRTDYKYEYFPVGFGGWLAQDAVTTYSPTVQTVADQRLLWNGATYTAEFTQTGDSYSGNSIVAPGQTRTISGDIAARTFESYTAIPPLISSTGSTGIGSYTKFFPGNNPAGCFNGSFTQLRNTWIVQGVSTVFTPINCALGGTYWRNDRNDIANFYAGNSSVLPTVKDDVTYALLKSDGSRIVYSIDEILFSGSRDMLVQRWALNNGIRQANWKKTQMYGFVLPDDESSVLGYDRFTMQIQYHP